MNASFSPPQHPTFMEKIACPNTTSLPPSVAYVQLGLCNPVLPPAHNISLPPAVPMFLN